MSNDSKSFAFDEWMRLASSDPEAFEERRRQAIEEMIAGAPPETQQRLRGLQWRIDVERGRSQNPTMAFLRLYRMMWDSVYSERGLLNALNGLVGIPMGRSEEPQAQADVVPFDPQRRPS